MRYLFYLCLLIVILNSKILAQSKSLGKYPKFSAALLFTPEVVFLGKLPAEVKLGNRLSFTFGFYLRYNFSKEFSLTTGIQSSNKAFMAYVTVRDKNNNYVGSFKKKSTYAFLELPLLFNYEKEHNKWLSVYSTVGALFGYLSHEKVADPGAHTPAILFDGPNAYLYQSKAYVYDRTDLDNFGYYRYVISSYLGIGAKIKLDRNVSFLIQPNFKCALTDMHKPSPSPFPLQYTGRPFSFGVMAGCFVRI
jgi:hypothetical protein